VSKFSEGDWVIVRRNALDMPPLVGYLKDILVARGSYRRRSLRVRIVRRLDGKPISWAGAEILVRDLDITPYPPEEGTLQDLIDFALDARDREWFLELSEQLKQQRETTAPTVTEE